MECSPLPLSKNNKTSTYRLDIYDGPRLKGIYHEIMYDNQLNNLKQIATQTT